MKDVGSFSPVKDRMSDSVFTRLLPKIVINPPGATVRILGSLTDEITAEIVGTAVLIGGSWERTTPFGRVVVCRFT